MAESQRSAFRANMEQLDAAFAADDDKAGRSAVKGLASLLFYDLDRAVDALERIADAAEKGARRG